MQVDETPTSDATAGDGARGDRRWWLVAAVGAVAAIAIGTLVIAANGGESGPQAAKVADLSDPRTPVDHEFIIPAGTGDRIDAGEQVDIMPANLVVHVGETMRIVNEDSRGHDIGPYFVGREETITQTFTQPGQLVGECSVHPSERLVIDVLP